MEAVSLKKRKRKSLPDRIIHGLTNISLLIVLALFVGIFWAQPVWMKGHSMEPTAASESLLLINRMYYRLSVPKQFDIIAFNTDAKSELQIKRIIAVPGDTIRIEEGNIYINDILCTEAQKYIHDLTAEGLAKKELTVGAGEYFVLGDNAAYSEDSRFADMGMVDKEQIEGKVWFAAESLLSFRFLH